MPSQTLPGPAGQPAPSVVLVSGSSIDRAQLTAVAGRVIPGNYTTYRTAVLASLASSPLQHGAGLIILLTIATAAAFGLFIVILGLALGSAERELTLARLTVMGHDRPAGLVLAEAMPAVLAAVVAGAVCAVVLPRVIGSSIDLSAFTGTSAPVQFEPDALALGLPAVAILVLALVALVTQAGRCAVTTSPARCGDIRTAFPDRTPDGGVLGGADRGGPDDARRRRAGDRARRVRGAGAAARAAARSRGRTGNLADAQRLGRATSGRAG